LALQPVGEQLHLVPGIVPGQTQAHGTGFGSGFGFFLASDTTFSSWFSTAIVIGLAENKATAIIIKMNFMIYLLTSAWCL
jgi:hypothetical protein